MRRGLCALALAALACASTGPVPVDGVWKGYYAHGPRARTFRPCGSKQVYWVVGENALLHKLRTEHAHETAAPYQAAYAELRGTVSKEKRSGRAAQYDGVFQVEEMVTLRAVAAGDCK